MTYRYAAALQAALHAALRAHPEVVAIVGDRVWDAPPRGAAQGAEAGPFLLIGDETVEPWGAADTEGAAHLVTLTAMGATGGFATLKRLADAACEAALGPLPLDRGRVVSARFLGARTARGEASLRRIDLRLRLVVEADGREP